MQEASQEDLEALDDFLLQEKGDNADGAKKEEDPSLLA